MRKKHLEFIKNDTKERGETITSEITFFGLLYQCLVIAEGEKKSKRVDYSAATLVMPGYRPIRINSNERLTDMQKFFLNTIVQSKEEVNPGYLANLYYESIGKRRHAASRDSFGQTSASYRTCRKLASLNLVKEIHYKTPGGYSYTMYSALT